MDAKRSCLVGVDAGWCRWILMFAMTAVLAGADAARADVVTIRRSATIASNQVRLSDVAQLSGAVESLAEVVVGQLDAGAAEGSISLQKIRDVLVTHGANLAKVELRGFDACTIRRAQPPTNASQTKGAGRDGDKSDATDRNAAATPALANPADEVTKDASFTLRDRIVGWLEQWTGVPRDSLRVTFADRDAKVLDQAALDERIVISPGGAAKLGRLPLTVQRFRGDKLIDTHRITLDTARRMLAVVAVRSISKAAVIGDGDVEVREVFLDRERGTLVTKLNQVIGLKAASTLREGAILAEDDIAPDLLVQKNELIRVRVQSGGLVVQMVGRALESGVRGQMIPVRNERSREVMLVEITGLRSGTCLADELSAKEPVDAAAPGRRPRTEPKSQTKGDQ